jgi:hypothetical protein
MLDANRIKYQWEHREEYITVQGVLLDEEQTMYLIEVLKECNIPGDDCYLRNTTIISRVMEYIGRGETPSDCARQLEKENKRVMEYA